MQSSLKNIFRQVPQDSKNFKMEPQQIQQEIVDPYQDKNSVQMLIDFQVFDPLFICDRETSEFYGKSSYSFDDARNSMSIRELIKRLAKKEKD